MKGDDRVIDYLNELCASELTAISQYWLHFRFSTIRAQRSLSPSNGARNRFEEMRHADKLTGRILPLEGFPNMQVLDPLRIGQTVEEILSCDLAAELSARALYTEAARYAITSLHDRVTKELYDELLIDEEHHIDFLETQQELIRQVGVQLYSQKHIGELSKDL